MERLTECWDLGFDEVDQIGYLIPNVEERGMYTIFDLAKHMEDESDFKDMLKKISLKLAEYEDLGMGPEEIIEEIKILKYNNRNMKVILGRQYDNLRELVEELEKDCDYWKREALKWCNEIGEQRIGPLIWMDEERVRNEKNRKEKYLS